MPIVLVAIGGAIGSVLRYLVINQMIMLIHPKPFPLGTLLVNIIGSLIIGVVMAQLAARGITENARLFLVTGVLGGFTTFSAFSWDTLQLMQRGALAQAMIYVLGSVVISFIAVAIGFQLAR